MTNNNSESRAIMKNLNEEPTKISFVGNDKRSEEDGIVSCSVVDEAAGQNITNTTLSCLDTGNDSAVSLLESKQKIFFAKDQLLKEELLPIAPKKEQQDSSYITWSQAKARRRNHRMQQQQNMMRDDDGLNDDEDVDRDIQKISKLVDELPSKTTPSKSLPLVQKATSWDGSDRQPFTETMEMSDYPVSTINIQEHNQRRASIVSVITMSNYGGSDRSSSRRNATQSYGNADEVTTNNSHGTLEDLPVYEQRREQLHSTTAGEALPNADADDDGPLLEKMTSNDDNDVKTFNTIEIPKNFTDSSVVSGITNINLDDAQKNEPMQQQQQQQFCNDSSCHQQKVVSICSDHDNNELHHYSWEPNMAPVISSVPAAGNEESTKLNSESGVGVDYEINNSIDSVPTHLPHHSTLEQVATTSDNMQFHDSSGLFTVLSLPKNRRGSLVSALTLNDHSFSKDEKDSLEASLDIGALEQFMPPLNNEAIAGRRGSMGSVQNNASFPKRERKASILPTPQQLPPSRERKESSRKLRPREQNVSIASSTSEQHSEKLDQEESRVDSSTIRRSSPRKGCKPRCSERGIAINDKGRPPLLTNGRRASMTTGSNDGRPIVLPKRTENKQSDDDDNVVVDLNTCTNVSPTTSTLEERKRNQHQQEQKFTSSASTIGTSLGASTLSASLGTTEEDKDNGLWDRTLPSVESDSLVRPIRQVKPSNRMKNSRKNKPYKPPSRPASLRSHNDVSTVATDNLSKPYKPPSRPASLRSHNDVSAAATDNLSKPYKPPSRPASLRSHNDVSTAATDNLSSEWSFHTRSDLSPSDSRSLHTSSTTLFSSSFGRRPKRDDDNEAIGPLPVMPPNRKLSPVPDDKLPGDTSITHLLPRRNLSKGPSYKKDSKADKDAYIPSRKSRSPIIMESSSQQFSSSSVNPSIQNNKARSRRHQHTGRRRQQHCPSSNTTPARKTIVRQLTPQWLKNTMLSRYSKNKEGSKQNGGVKQ